MKREEADALIEECASYANDSGVGVGGSLLERLCALARLGASVAAPRDDEIEAMILAWFEGAPATNNPEFAPRMRAALSALRESKP